MKIKAIKPTWVKAKPDQAQSLTSAQKFQVREGQVLGVLNAWDDIKGHARVMMADKLTVGGVIWKDAYLWQGHWEGFTAIRATKTLEAAPFSRSGSTQVLLPTPYFAQNDNKDWGDDGSASNLRYGGVQCGLTSLAMVLATIWPNDKIEKLRKESGGQFEDWVAGQFKKYDLRSIAAADHVAVLDKLGIKAYFTTTATVGELKERLERHPCVLGTAYKVSGHFICARGFDRGTGDVIINDPYGKRLLSGSFNQWEAVCKTNADKFGQANRYNPWVLDNIWVDGGDASGWAVFLDPDTPNYANGDSPVQFPKQQIVLPTATEITHSGGVIDAGKLKASIKATAHPQLPPEEIDELVAACLSEFPKYQLTNPKEIAHFLTQVGHESGGYWWLEEIASGEDYEGREDLGNTDAGDGKRFKGRGLIQLTGRANYQAFKTKTGIDVISNPDPVAKYPLALASALYFWDRERLSEIAEEGFSDEVCEKVTRIVNGGTNGLDDRLSRLDKLKKIWT